VTSGPGEGATSHYGEHVLEVDEGLDDDAGAGAASAPSTAPYSRWFLTAVGVAVVAASVLRLLYIPLDRRHVEFVGDAYYYHAAGNLLADGEGFIHPYPAMEGRAVESADHPPLYILYLAGWSLMGVRSITGHLLVSALLGVASVVFAALIGRRVAGERAGVVAAVLVALYPNVWRYDGMLMSETMVILAVLVTVWLAYRFWDHRTPGRLLALAAAVGLATLARSELGLLAPLLIVPIVLLVKERSWGWRVGWLAAAAGTVLAVLAPWLVLNQTRFEEPVLLSQNLGGTLAVSYCPTVFEGELLGYWDFHCGIRALDEAGVGPLGDPRIDSTMREAGLKFASENLDRFPVVMAARMGRITGTFRPLQQRDLDVFLENTSRWVADAGTVTLPFVLVGAVAGSVILRRRRTFQLPLVAPIACVVITVLLFYAATRFRATAEGPLCVLAAVAVAALWDRVRGPRAADGPAPPRSVTADAA
jgi:4-amino-4-deoxy-L-arabinose transferase-like glycosyltransferase